MDHIQVLSGSLAGLIFAAGSWNMLVKAWRTKDLRSYSLGQLVFNNVGNFFYWLYVVSLPFGPIYFMHSFFTLVSLLMLAWYCLYCRPSVLAQSRPARAWPKALAGAGDEWVLTERWGSRPSRK